MSIMKGSVKFLNKAVYSILSKRVTRRWLSKTGVQNLLNYLHDIVVYCLFTGGGASVSESGEVFVLNYIKKKNHNDEELVVFDVGACEGEFAICANNILGKTKIFSFEPSLATYNKLNDNIKNIENIIPQNFGFSDFVGESNFYRFDNNDSSASLFKRRLEHFGIKNYSNESVAIRTIDDFCSDLNINKINFLKVDVEGNELKVFEGAKEMLKNKQIDFIQFEFGGCNIDSRTYFQDFYYLFKDNFRIFKVLSYGLYEIHDYNENLEIFYNTNYFMEKK